MTIECTCETCGKNFQSQKDSTICYTCSLKNLTGNNIPEEGDFNSARITSGEMTDQEMTWLYEDLRSVESGCSIREYYDDTDDDVCPLCGGNRHVCDCDSKYND